jgi:uncharacterized membrane protein YkvA (DUF1232 family)
MGKNKITKEQLDLYKDDYNESDFWDKIKKYGKTAGAAVVYNALKLYYASTSKETPIGIKALIYGALGYFIFPVDLVPDIIPVVGFADDLAALTTALASAYAYINDEVRQQAKDKLEDWFDDVNDSDIED